MKMLGLKLDTVRIRYGGTRVHCGSNTTDLLGSPALNVSVNVGDEFPWFLPKEVRNVKDPFVRALAKRYHRLPVQVSPSAADFSESCIMSSCLKPRTVQSDANPVVLLHCFDSSCLEWRCTFPLLEDAGLETWAIDVLGWGFSDLETLPPCNPASKRDHLYQFWKSHIKRPMVLVGPSLGGAIAIDFAVNFPEAVHKLVLINACVYAGGTCFLQKLPRVMAYAMVSLLKSVPLRLFAKFLMFDGLSLSTILDWTNVSRLHCLLPWWKEATISYMLSGGFNVTSQVEQVQQRVLILWGERDNIIESKHAERLQNELPNATLQLIPAAGHFPHVEKPSSVAKLIAEFAQEMTVRT